MNNEHISHYFIISRRSAFMTSPFAGLHRFHIRAYTLSVADHCGMVFNYVYCFSRCIFHVVTGDANSKYIEDNLQKAI